MQKSKQKKCCLSIIAVLIAVVAVLISIIALQSRDYEEPPLTKPVDEEESETTESVIAEERFDSSEAPSGKIINVPKICQYPELPTGCEATAAAMALQYYGETLSAQEFAADWLSCSEAFYSSDGKLCGPDPNEVFVGNPFTKSSYGCYAAPIVSAVNNHSRCCRATELRGVSLESLCREYVDNDVPILIWATMGMKPSANGNTWYLEDGSQFTWVAGEHCLVLVGYDEKNYIFNDPQSGSTVSYPKELADKRYEELGTQAVYIIKTDNAL